MYKLVFECSVEFLYGAVVHGDDFQPSRCSHRVKHLHNVFCFTRCQPCACDPVGSVNGSCHQDSGVCVCKLLVTGDKCDVCQPGARHLDPENLFGCSKGLCEHVDNTHIVQHPLIIHHLSLNQLID